MLKTESVALFNPFNPHHNPRVTGIAVSHYCSCSCTLSPPPCGHSPWRELPAPGVWSTQEWSCPQSPRAPSTPISMPAPSAPSCCLHFGAMVLWDAWKCEMQHVSFVSFPLWYSLRTAKGTDFKAYSLMSFDKCTRPRKLHVYQDREHSRGPLSINLFPGPGDLWSAFSPYRWVPAALQLPESVALMTNNVEHLSNLLAIYKSFFLSSTCSFFKKLFLKITEL